MPAQPFVMVRPISLVGSSVVTSSSIPEPATGADPDPAAFAASTAYALGARVYLAATHKIYECISAYTSTATTPPNDTTHWIEVGYTNKWRMFDGANNTQSSVASPLTFTLTPNAVADMIMFDNVDADSIRVQINGTSYDETVNLKSRTAMDWYSYFFEPFYYKKTALFRNLPNLTSNVINVTITKASGVVKVGTCVLGQSKPIGYAQYGAQVGTVDYSLKQTDQFGNTTVVPRAFSKRMNVQVLMNNSLLDEVVDMFSQYRATPVVWAAVGDEYTSMIIYGFYKSYDVVIAYPTQSQCNLEIEGLT